MGGGEQLSVDLRALLSNKRLLLARVTLGSRALLAVGILDAQQNRRDVRRRRDTAAIC